MGRGHGFTAAVSDGEGRRDRVDARQAVQRLYGQRLRELAPADRYRLGDVGRRLLAAFGVDLEDSIGHSRQHLPALLPSKAEVLNEVGMSGALIRDGIPPLPTLQQLLERGLVAGPVPEDADAFYEQTLTAFRLQARNSRECELDWITRHLRFVPERLEAGWDSEATRALLVDIWLAQAGPRKVPDLVAEVIRRGR